MTPSLAMMVRFMLLIRNSWVGLVDSIWPKLLKWLSR